MNTLSQLVLGMLFAGVCAGVCAGQEEKGAAASTNETKNLVQGKVVQEPGGQGIRKVKVSFRGKSGYEAITDEKGQFRVEGMEPGAYRVQLQRPGYAADSKTNLVITVTAGQDTKDLMLHMVVAAVISGKIVDPDGDPLRDVSVVAIANNVEAMRRNEAQSRGGATNDLGEYRIADLSPGKYIVQATPPRNLAPLPSPNQKDTTKGRLAYVMTYFPGTQDKGQAAVVEVAPGGTATANFGVLASYAYRVSGTVVGLGTQPMAQLFLVGTNGQREEHPLDLQEGGKFEFPSVLPGTYRAHLIVISGFLNGQAPSLKMQTIRTPIEVNGSDVVGLQLQIDTGGDVSGRFRVDGDEKINWRELNVSLFAVPEGEEEVTELMPMSLGGGAKVNEDGSFEIKDAPGGSFQLAVGASSEKLRDYYTKSVLLGGREVVDTGFAVRPGTMLDVVVSAKGAGIEGTVVDKDGKPVAEANVVTVPSSGKLERPDAYQFGRTDENGHFVLRGMNPGKFVVLAFEEMEGDYRAPDFAKKYEGKGEKVELEEGAKKSVVLKLITVEGKGP